MRALLAAVALVAFATTGCRGVVRDGYYEEPVVYHHAEVVHVHDAFCGHVWDGRAWVHLGVVHRHYAGCGHYWYGGRWCVTETWEEPVVQPVVHVHSAMCGHVWCDDAWVVCPS